MARTVTALSVWVCQVTGRAQVWEVAAESRQDATALFESFLEGSVLAGRAFTVAGKDQALLAWGKGE